MNVSRQDTCANMFRPGTFGRLLNYNLQTKFPISPILASVLHPSDPPDKDLTVFDWGSDMNFGKSLLAAVLLLAAVDASQAAIRIADDRGGQIGTYVAKYQGLRTSGETVIIDGLCASACTIVLGAVPHDRICVTSHANLGFHAAWDFGAHGRAVTNPDATQMLYSLYPSPVRRWIAARGGLKSQMIFLRGKELMSMYRPCYLDAQASSPR
jgi:hypothetical protein